MATTDAFTSMHDQMMAECRDMIDKKIATVKADAISAGVMQAVQKIVAARPQVNVAAPHVAVPAPTVTVNVPEMEAGEVTVHVDMAPVAAAIATQTALLTDILTALNMPVTKTVHRDGQWISSVTETRG